MNPTAIYSKSGKGVQEASGKTSLLKRPDRAVLSAIDGRATLADVAQKVGKSFDTDFQKLVTQMDKDGFIREVSPGASPAAARPAGPAAKAPPKPAAPSAPMDAASDLDFSSFAPLPKPASPPPRPAAPAAPAAKAPAQTSALNKAREEAESKAAAERDRIKAETEAKMRAELEATARVETEAKMKAEAASKAKADSEAKVRADAEAKIKAARDAAVRTAAEAKAKADAEARRGREEAEKAKRESEDLKQRLEEERKAREDAERKAKDESARARKELEEERKRLEEKERKAEEERAERRRREEEEEKARRKQREEEERKADEERAARSKREEEEEKAQKKQKEEERKHREEEERKAEEERAARRKREEEEEERQAEEERAARRKKREEEEALARAAEEEERRIRAEEAEAERQRLAAEEDRRKSEAQKSIAEMTPKAAAPDKPAAGGGFDSLLADLDSFGKKDDQEAKAKEEGDRKAKEAARRAQEEAAREREEEERRASEERAARRKREADEEEAKAEEERAARRKKREEEDRREEEERKAEQKKRDEEEEAEKKSKRKKKDDDIPVSDDDLGMDDVKRDQRAMAGRKKEKAYVAPPPVTASVRRRPTNWGKPVTLGLILLLAVAVGVVHVMPLGTAEYERAASEAIGRPVKIASGRMWLFSGLQLKLQGVTVGDNVKIANVTAFPTFDTLSGDKKTFTRIDLEGIALPQEALSELLFAKVKSDKFSVARVVAKQLELTGAIALPKGLEADIALGADGALSSVTVRGPDTLVAKLSPKESTVEFDVDAGGFVVPFASEMTLGNFGMKGTATRQGMSITEWDGTMLNGKISGTANVRWGSNWTVDGVMTARGLNAAVFAPALVSEGRGEGTAKFSMSGPDPAKLGATGRYDGSFKIETGALGSVDLSRALRTGGRETAGRTEFTDLTGQATYDRGAVTLRNVQLNRSSLNAGISADIARDGALSGRIVADVRAGSQTLRATLTMGGTSKDPQFRN